MVRRLIATRRKRKTELKFNEIYFVCGKVSYENHKALSECVGLGPIKSHHLIYFSECAVDCCRSIVLFLSPSLLHRTPQHSDRTFSRATLFSLTNIFPSLPLFLSVEMCVRRSSHTATRHPRRTIIYTRSTQHTARPEIRIRPFRFQCFVFNFHVN